MSGPRLRYILGGAVLGALLGAVYANYLYTMYGNKETESEIIVPNHTATAASEIIDNEPERAASAAVQRRAAKSREVTDSNE